MSEIVDKYQSRRLSQETFLERSIQVHGDRYDYSEAKFVRIRDKVAIKCKVHGVFLQTPKSHFSGQGCPQCNPTKAHTNEHFIQKAKEVHGDLYTYDKVEYVNSFVKVTITCRVHGDFQQAPYCHINGQGCSICGKLRKTTSEEDFIKKSKEIHNNKYDYSKVNYINSYTPVTITCPIHGDFKQKPVDHLLDHGCYTCGREALRINKEGFIKKANEVHNNKYDYSKTNFKVTRDFVEIICPEHGVFRQKANNHLNGLGCPGCSVSPKRVFNTEQFIERANIVHNNLYDYSKVDYVNATSKVIITCKKESHGDFLQNPHNHLKGTGCPICSESKGETAIRNLLLKQNIMFKREYNLPEVNLRLRCDFYLPEYDLLIEFHGQQHYDYIPFFHRNGEDDLSSQKHRDKLVRHLAREFKYSYLEFNYQDLCNKTKEEFEEFVLSRILKCKKRTRVPIPF